MVTDEALEQLESVLSGMDELRGAVLQTSPLGFTTLVDENEVTLAQFFREGIGEALVFGYTAIPDLVRTIHELRAENDELEAERDALAAKEYRRASHAEREERRRR